MALIHANVGNAIKVLWIVTLHAIAVWALLAPPVIYALYRVLVPVLQRLAQVSGLRKPADGPEAC